MENKLKDSVIYLPWKIRYKTMKCSSPWELSLHGKFYGVYKSKEEANIALLKFDKSISDKNQLQCKCPSLMLV